MFKKVENSFYLTAETGILRRYTAKKIDAYEFIADNIALFSDEYYKRFNEEYPAFIKDLQEAGEIRDGDIYSIDVGHDRPNSPLIPGNILILHEPEEKKTITIYGTDYKTDEEFIEAAKDAWNRHNDSKVQILNVTEHQSNLVMKIIRHEL